MIVVGVPNEMVLVKAPAKKPKRTGKGFEEILAEEMKKLNTSTDQSEDVKPQV